MNGTSVMKKIVNDTNIAAKNEIAIVSDLLVLLMMLCSSCLSRSLCLYYRRAALHYRDRNVTDHLIYFVMRYKNV